MYYNCIERERVIENWHLKLNICIISIGKKLGLVIITSNLIIDLGPFGQSQKMVLPCDIYSYYILITYNIYISYKILINILCDTVQSYLLTVLI